MRSLAVPALVTMSSAASIFFSLPGAAGAQSGKQCSTSSSCKLFVETENDGAYTVSSSSAFAQNWTKFDYYVRCAFVRWRVAQED